ncbi:MAG TPA: DinB family protein [Chitinophagaceae bacterium]|nr:DinB family protein [Chitinophagaceae bacterium]
MNRETQSIISNFQNVLNGKPWYGRSVFAITSEIDPTIVYKEPASPADGPNANAHSLIELLYHSLTWAEYTLEVLQNAGEKEIAAIKKLDWREINPAVHTWDKGVTAFKAVHEKIIHLLQEKNDEFLNEKANPHNFNYGYLLNGLLQHDIYHLGQIAYVKKMFS